LKNIQIPRPEIKFEIENQNQRVLTFLISASCISPFTFLQTSLKGRFSDNGFLLLPNQPTRSVL